MFSKGISGKLMILPKPLDYETGGHHRRGESRQVLFRRTPAEVVTPASMLETLAPVFAQPIQQEAHLLLVIALRKFPLQQRVGMQEEAHRLRIMSFPNA